MTQNALLRPLHVAWAAIRQSRLMRAAPRVAEPPPENQGVPRARYDFCTYESRFAFALGSISAAILSRQGKLLLRRPKVNEAANEAPSESTSP